MRPREVTREYIDTTDAKNLFRPPYHAKAYPEEYVLGNDKKVWHSEKKGGVGAYEWVRTNEVLAPKGFNLTIGEPKLNSAPKSPKPSASKSKVKVASKSHSASKSPAPLKKKPSKPRAKSNKQKCLDKGLVKSKKDQMCHVRRARSAYNYFVSEHFSSLRKNDQHGKLLLGDTIRAIAGKWENANRTPYIKKSEQDHARHDKELQKHPKPVHP
jgi:HMG-box domain